MHILLTYALSVMLLGKNNNLCTYYGIYALSVMLLGKNNNLCTFYGIYALSVMFWVGEITCTCFMVHMHFQLCCV